MTRQEFTNQLPEFAGGAMGIKPPLVFRNVSARYFTLRANLDLVQQLVDNYVNIVPHEIGFFRVSAPYVNLVVLDYGQMGEAEMTAGWFSQVEVYFSVGLEWYKRVRGQYVFHDWAVITPYIFVTDDVSAPVGRTVYGFQKIFSQLELTESQWVKSPTSPTVVARLATQLFPKTYSGGKLENRVFLEIDRKTMSRTQVPVDPKDPSLPWNIAANFATAINGMSRDMMWMPQALRIFPFNALTNPTILPAMLGKIAPSFLPGQAGYSLNSINLKQFRRASNPAEICYQALTNAQMQTTAFNGAGLLGENRVQLGDISGGYVIRLFEGASLPIVRTLGLDVHRSWRTHDGQQVDEIKPIMPIWMDVDLKFNAGSNLAWRTDRGIWRDETGIPIPGAAAQPKPRFNNTVSTSIEAIAGPFQFAGTTIRVVPLLAEKVKLRAFLDHSINNAIRDSAPLLEKDGSPAEYVVQLQLWCRGQQPQEAQFPKSDEFAYVYLTGFTYDSVTSESNNVGDWAKYEMSFMIPVKWQRMKRAEWEEIRHYPDAALHPSWETVGVGLVPSFSLADNTITAISRSEIQGIATGRANFIRPESVWLGAEGKGDDAETLLRVDMELLPAVTEGLDAAVHPLIQINTGGNCRTLGSDPDAPWKWAEQLRLELNAKNTQKAASWDKLKVARALGLELLGNQTPFSLYTLKQFRDVSDPDKACYQALIRVSKSLANVYDMQEIEETLTVQITDYPEFGIVESLGIVANRIDTDSAGIDYNAQGVRPFFIRCTLDEPPGERVLTREGLDAWTIHSAAFGTMLSGEPASPPITVDLRAETLQDRVDPSRTQEVMYQARERRSSGTISKDDEISPSMAKDAIEAVDPQAVIEAALSREWSNQSPSAHWRAGRAELEKRFAVLPEQAKLAALAEVELARQLNNELATAPGAVAAQILSQELPALLQGAPLVTSELMGSSLQRELLGESIAQAFAKSMIIADNLSGQGPATRWRKDLANLLRGQYALTQLRLRMEANVDVISPLSILGLRGMKYLDASGQFDSAYDSSAPSYNADIINNWLGEFVKTAKDLLQVAQEISASDIQGGPGISNLDPLVRASCWRIGEILAALTPELLTPLGSQAEAIELVRRRFKTLSELIELCRTCAKAQRDGLINKLSRGYQKPDYCVLRNSVGGEADSLFPRALSWSADWFSGHKVNLIESMPDENGEPKVDAPSEMQPHPAENAPKAEE